jgi:hypothetical protein
MTLDSKYKSLGARLRDLCGAWHLRGWYQPKAIPHVYRMQ